MGKKEYEKMKKDVIEFFKAAFCVDGSVRVIGSAKEHEKLIMESNSVVIELNDSERGTFYIVAFNKEKKL